MIPIMANNAKYVDVPKVFYRWSCARYTRISKIVPYNEYNLYLLPAHDYLSQ